jgi:hypothetical protein
MAKLAKDGTPFTNQMGVNSRNASLAAKPQPSAAPSDPGTDAQGQPPPIQDDPEAMQCIETLKSKGYTADDVEQAMGGGDDPSQGQSAQGAPPAASLNIPGM